MFFRQYLCEMRKLWARPRSYIGFAAFLGLQILIFFFLQREGSESFWKKIIERQGGAFEEFFSATTLGFIVLALSVILLGGIYLALVAGDIVAKEAEDGTLRMVLARPVSRFRVLAIKYAAAVSYNFLFLFFMGVTAWLLGIALRGPGGGFFAFAPEVGVVALHTGHAALGRYFLCVIFIAISMVSVTSLAFFFSCMKVKPAAATILTLSYLFVDMILARGGFMEDYKHLLINTYTSTWAKLALDPLPWALILKNYTILAGISITLFTLGWMLFDRRDFKS